MTNNDVRRNYNITDADLCMFVSNFCNIATRDLIDFENFGLNIAKIDNLRALGDEFERFPSDAVFVGDIMIATENKKALRERVLETIRNMAIRVEAKWGTDSAKYRRLDLKAPSKLPEDSLLVATRDVHSKMTEYLGDLGDLGLTQQMLDDFEDLNEQFELSMNMQADALAARDTKTVERIQKGNELYNLVSMYCEIGKRIYANTNSAKYNDYVIYSSATISKKRPKTLKNDG